MKLMLSICNLKKEIVRKTPSSPESFQNRSGTSDFHAVVKNINMF